jgi:hypothetical protein
MKNFTFIICSWLLLVSACDPCADCGKPLVYDPSVKMIFINKDSADALQLLINENSSIKTIADSSVKALNASITALSDSLIVLDTLIANGQVQYESTRDSFLLAISDFENLVVANTLVKTKIDSVNKVFNSVVTKINKGTVQLLRTYLVEETIDLDYPDSTSLFRLPLLLATGQSTYEIQIGDSTYTIAFQYDTYEAIDDARIARIRAVNLDTIYHTFDSLVISCQTNQCISDETTVTAYF